MIMPKNKKKKEGGVYLARMEKKGTRGEGEEVEEEEERARRRGEGQRWKGGGGQGEEERRWVEKEAIDGDLHRTHPTPSVVELPK